MTRSKPSLLILLFFMVLTLSCCGGKGPKAAEEPAATATVDLSIGGMTCTGCENTICSNLEKLPGVKSVTASHTEGKAIIEYEPDKVDTLKLKETVDALGYKALKVSAAAAGSGE